MESKLLSDVIKDLTDEINELKAEVSRWKRLAKDFEDVACQAEQDSVDHQAFVDSVREYVRKQDWDALKAFIGYSDLTPAQIGTIFDGRD